MLKTHILGNDRFHISMSISYQKSRKKLNYRNKLNVFAVKIS